MPVIRHSIKFQLKSFCKSQIFDRSSSRTIERRSQNKGNISRYKEYDAFPHGHYAKENRSCKDTSQGYKPIYYKSNVRVISKALD